VKRLLRLKAVQELLSRLIAAYVDLVTATLRWRYENRQSVDAVMIGSHGALGFFWHGRIAQAMACRPLLADKPRRVMISLSRDGEFIALAAERLGVPTIRGSAGKNDGSLVKGGATAFRRAVDRARAGEVVLLTPDGPRGPREVMPMGPIRLAQATDCPVFLMGLAARPTLLLGGWDAGRVPLPFARAALVVAGPLGVPAHAEEAELQTLRGEWQARMRAAQARAEALL